MRRAARVLVPLGAVCVVLLIGQWHAANRGHYEFAGSSRFTWSLTYAGLLALAAYAVGLPDLARTRRSAMVASLSACAFGAGGISVVQLALGSQLLPRFVVAGSALALMPWYMACTVVANGGRKQERWHDRVVAVVGDPQEGAALVAELGRVPEHDARVVEVVALDDARTRGLYTEPLVDTVILADATVLVLDRAAAADDSIVAQAATLHEAGIRIRTLALFYEEWLGKLPLSELERTSLMFDIGEVHRARYGREKRILDVGLGLAGCAVLLLAVPVVAVANLIGNRGPLFYRQPRVGRDRSRFTIFKFRTMRTSAGPTSWTGDDDPRVTPVGKWLRRTHLDELPQAWNILRGDLSVVGPRPEQPHYVEELAAKLPWYHSRHLVRPGLTGWAQVKYNYGSNEADALEKLQYELYYLRHQSVSLDLRVIGRTLRSVVGRGGR